ncbi:MAG: helicase-related protein, partial [Myxococcota bacterium]
VLVATTVIEVGVDVPEATCMVIANAERFGLSQLHQLRGRVGRGAATSECWLLVGSGGEDARRRLSAMETTNDGFRIAEEDLAIRGPGDFLGTRQSGMPTLLFADLAKHAALLELARELAWTLTERDPHLEAPAHRGLRDLVHRRFRDRIALTGAG